MRLQLKWEEKRNSILIWKRNTNIHFEESNASGSVTLKCIILGIDIKLWRRWKWIRILYNGGISYDGCWNRASVVRNSMLLNYCHYLNISALFFTLRFAWFRIPQRFRWDLHSSGLISNVQLFCYRLFGTTSWSGPIGRPLVRYYDCPLRNDPGDRGSLAAIYFYS